MHLISVRASNIIQAQKYGYVNYDLAVINNDRIIKTALNVKVMTPFELP